MNSTANLGERGSLTVEFLSQVSPPQEDDMIEVQGPHQVNVTIGAMIDQEKMNYLLTHFTDLKHVKIFDLPEIPLIPKRTFKLIIKLLNQESDAQSRRALLMHLRPIQIRVGDEIQELSPLVWKAYSTFDGSDYLLPGIKPSVIRFINQLFWEDDVKFPSNSDDLLDLATSLSLLKISCFDRQLVTVLRQASREVKKENPARFLSLLACLSSYEDQRFVDSEVSNLLRKAKSSIELINFLNQIRNKLIFICSLILEGHLINEDVIRELSDKFPNLKHVSFVNCNLTDATMSYLTKLTKLVRLDFTKCHQLTSETGNPTSQLPNLKILAINNCKNIDSRFFNYFKINHKLISLKLGPSIRDLSFLHKFPELSHLQINEISEDLKVLKKLKRLTIFDAVIKDNFVDFLNNWKNLEILELKDCSVNNQSTDKSSTLDSLLILMCDGVKFASNEFSFLEKFPNLKGLVMSSCSILIDNQLIYLQDEASRSISKLKKLEHLDMGNTQMTDASLPFFIKLRPRLKELKIGLHQFSTHLIS